VPPRARRGRGPAGGARGRGGGGARDRQEGGPRAGGRARVGPARLPGPPGPLATWRRPWQALRRRTLHCIHSIYCIHCIRPHPGGTPSAAPNAPVPAAPPLTRPALPARFCSAAGAEVARWRAAAESAQAAKQLLAGRARELTLQRNQVGAGLRCFGVSGGLACVCVGGGAGRGARVPPQAQPGLYLTRQGPAAPALRRPCRRARQRHSLRGRPPSHSPAARRVASAPARAPPLPPVPSKPCATTGPCLPRPRPSVYCAWA
jgi:hypothetical protein